MNPFRLLLALLPFLFSALQANPPVGEEGEGDDEGKEGEQKGEKSKVEFTAEQSAEISKIVAREARKAADKAKADAETARKAADEEAAKAAERKKQEDAGEFAQVRQSLEGERDTLKGERDSLKATNDALTVYFSSQYEAALKDLPDTILAFKPADDASFEAKSDWLTKAQEQAKKLGTNGNPGNRQNPAPGTGKPEIPSAIPLSSMF